MRGWYRVEANSTSEREEKLIRVAQGVQTRTPAPQWRRTSHSQLLQIPWQTAPATPLDKPGVFTTFKILGDETMKKYRDPLAPSPKLFGSRPTAGEHDQRLQTLRAASEP